MSKLRQQLIDERKTEITLEELIKQSLESKNCAEEAIDKFILAEELKRLEEDYTL